MTHYLIYGASRGLGDALNRGVPVSGDQAWLVSRAKAFTDGADGVTRHWLHGDLAEVATGSSIARALDGVRLDVVIYNAGIWEDTAFGPHYDVTAVSDAETQQVITVNLTSAITCLSKLLPNLRQSDNPKVMLIGSVNGLENTRNPEVAYNASKFGLRGVAHGLREHWHRHRIAVTCLNPGWIGGGGVPYADLCVLTRCLVAMSNQTCIKEIDIPAMSDPF
jgi:NAD(P)-dependent dehydrogenase (short-subunit alcohol dehydrogenase family)